MTNGRRQSTQYLRWTRGWALSSPYGRRGSRGGGLISYVSLFSTVWVKGKEKKTPRLSCSDPTALLGLSHQRAWARSVSDKAPPRAFRRRWRCVAGGAFLSAQLPVAGVGWGGHHLDQWFAAEVLPPRGHVFMTGDVLCVSLGCCWCLVGEGQGHCRRPCPHSRVSR